MSMRDSDRRQSLLDSIETMVHDGADAGDIIEAAADGLRRETHLDQVFVMVRENGDASLRIRYASLGTYEREQIRESMSMDLHSVVIPLDDEPMLADFFLYGKLAELKGISQVAELARAIAPHERIGNLAADAVRSQGIGYACVAPIATDGTLLGVVIASSYGRKPLTEDDTLLVAAVGTLLAATLHRE
ncbi:MAG: GAF domain-containing protein [Armatimonadota bacterium]